MRGSSVSLGGFNREPECTDGPAECNFECRVPDDEQRNCITRQESGSGDTVAGPCNYVNPTGTLVAVNCETIEAPTKKIIDVEQCYPVTRTVCSEC